MSDRNLAELCTIAASAHQARSENENIADAQKRVRWFYGKCEKDRKMGCRVDEGRAGHCFPNASKKRANQYIHRMALFFFQLYRFNTQADFSSTSDRLLSFIPWEAWFIGSWRWRSGRPRRTRPSRRRRWRPSSHRSWQRSGWWSRRCQQRRRRWQSPWQHWHSRRESCTRHTNHISKERKT